MRYETMLPTKKTYLHVILFDNFFFKSLMFVCLQKLLNCLIIYSYKTIPSFSPCPWNLRSIGPSDFKQQSSRRRFRQSSESLGYFSQSLESYRKCPRNCDGCTGISPVCFGRWNRPRDRTIRTASIPLSTGGSGGRCAGDVDVCSIPRTSWRCVCWLVLLIDTSWTPNHLFNKNKIINFISIINFHRP